MGAGVGVGVGITYSMASCGRDERKGVVAVACWSYGSSTYRQTILVSTVEDIAVLVKFLLLLDLLVRFVWSTRSAEALPGDVQLCIMKPQNRKIDDVGDGNRGFNYGFWRRSSPLSDYGAALKYYTVGRVTFCF